MKKMQPVVHFEMPSEDRNRMAKFYTEAFGWRTQMLGAEMGDYVLATTSETDENGMVKAPARSTAVFSRNPTTSLRNFPPSL